MAVSLARRSFLGLAGAGAACLLAACGSTADKGTLDITSNGEYDVSGYSKVNVSVGGDAGSAGDAADAGSGSADASGSSAAGSSAAGPAAASIGDEIPVSTKYGNLKVTVEGFETSADMTANSFSDTLTEGDMLGLLLLLVENVSYEDQYNQNSIALAPDVYVKDPSGVTLNPLSSSTDYGKYRGAAGGYAELPVGQKARIAVFYDVSPDMESVTVVAGNTSVDVPVARK